MADLEKDEVPMLLETEQPSVEFVESKLQRLISRTRSASMSIPMRSMEPYERETSHVGHTGPLRSERKTTFVQMSGPLHVTNRHGNLSRENVNATGNKAVESMTEKIALHGRVENDWQNNHAHKNEHLLRSGQLGMCNDPYCTTCPTYFKTSQQRNPKASGLFDPKEENCIFINWRLTWGLVCVRSFNDFVCFLNTLLQFRLAYVAPGSRVVGAGDLVDHPKKIALHYFKSYFFGDLFVVFPLPQDLMTKRGIGRDLNLAAITSLTIGCLILLHALVVHLLLTFIVGWVMCLCPL